MEAEIIPITSEIKEALSPSAVRRNVKDTLDGTAILEKFILEGEDGPGEHYDNPQERDEIVKALCRLFPVTNAQLIYRRVHSWPMSKLTAIPLITRSLLKEELKSG